MAKNKTLTQINEYTKADEGPPKPGKSYGRDDKINLTYRVSLLGRDRLQAIAQDERTSMQHIIDVALYEYKKKRGLPTDT